MTGAVEAAAHAAFDRRLDRSSRAPVAVAVSGGGDSMALLHLAAEWAAEPGRPLRVLTVDHGLNAESGAWARLVSEAATRLRLPCTVLRWEGPKPATGLPAAARTARHALLADAARAAGARVILLGHTADDLTEAEAMRAGGSTVGDPREWSPSPAWPEGRGVFLLRPLLGVPRGDLRGFLRSRGERWIEDPANADLRFARSQARLLRPSPLAGEGGAGAPNEGWRAERARDASKLSRSLECSVFSSALRRATPHPSAPRTPSPARGEGTNWGGLRLRIDDALHAPTLSAALVCASGRAQPPRGTKVAALADQLARGARATLSGARVVSAGDVVLVGRDAGRTGLPKVSAVVGEELVWDGRFAIVSDEPGTVGPLAGRAARLSKTERASLRPVPPWVRPTLPVLETSSGAVRLLPEARPLASERLRAACGVYACEADLPPP